MSEAGIIGAEDMLDPPIQAEVPRPVRLRHSHAIGKQSRVTHGPTVRRKPPIKGSIECWDGKSFDGVAALGINTGSTVRGRVGVLS
jgi:hypothetical protein